MAAYVSALVPPLSLLTSPQSAFTSAPPAREKLHDGGDRGHIKGDEVTCKHLCSIKHYLTYARVRWAPDDIRDKPPYRPRRARLHAGSLEVVIGNYKSPVEKDPEPWKTEDLSILENIEKIHGYSLSYADGLTALGLANRERAPLISGFSNLLAIYTTIGKLRQSFPDDLGNLFTGDLGLSTEYYDPVVRPKVWAYTKKAELAGKSRDLGPALTKTFGAAAYVAFLQAICPSDIRVPTGAWLKVYEIDKLYDHVDGIIEEAPSRDFGKFIESHGSSVETAKSLMAKLRSAYPGEPKLMSHAQDYASSLLSTINGDELACMVLMGGFITGVRSAKALPPGFGDEAPAAFFKKNPSDRHEDPKIQKGQSTAEALSSTSLPVMKLGTTQPPPNLQLGSWLLYRIKAFAKPHLKSSSKLENPQIVPEHIEIFDHS